MLSAEQVAEFHERGFVVPDYCMAERDLADIRAAHDRLIARHPELTDYCPTLLAYDLYFLNFARTPAILDMVEQILGPDFALWNSSFFAKPARIGSKTPWHQDGEYWPIRPVATCSVWIAIDASSTENGCLRVIPGSHKEKRLRRHRTNDAPGLSLNQELAPGEIDPSEAVDIVLDAGQISLHDVHLAHMSEPNRSARPRRAMTLRYMPTTSVFDRALAKDLVGRISLTDHSLRTLYLMRGTDRSGKNDFAMRR